MLLTLSADASVLNATALLFHCYMQKNVTCLSTLKLQFMYYLHSSKLLEYTPWTYLFRNFTLQSIPHKCWYHEPFSGRLRY